MKTTFFANLLLFCGVGIKLLGQLISLFPRLIIFIKVWFIQKPALDKSIRLQFVEYWVLKPKLLSLVLQRRVVFLGCCRPRFITFIILDSVDSVICNEPSDGSWFSIVLKAAVNAVVWICQKAVAINANHLLRDHFFFLPIESDLPANGSTAKFVLKTLCETCVFLNMLDYLLNYRLFYLLRYLLSLALWVNI